MKCSRHALALLALSTSASACLAADTPATLLQPVVPPGAAIAQISPAMRIDGGKLLLLSGHIPLHPDGHLITGSLEDQLEQVMRNLDATLRTAGSDFSHVARLTLYVRDLDPAQLAGIRAVRDRWINHDRPPASALIGVQALFHPQVQVEVDAIAVVPP